ncbi:MAG TPA: YgaP-like transmembrane domain [Azospirillaceae bacterium]|nr:YgaP-like transmembrane domain [Azospirillaceae bacterium]
MSDHRIERARHQVFGGAKNMGTAESVGSVVFGLAMAAGAVRQPNLRGLLMVVGGGLLVARGMSRHCPVKAMIENRGQGGMGRRGVTSSGRQDFAAPVRQDPVRQEQGAHAYDPAI